MESDIFPFEQSQRPFAHVVHTEAEFAHHDGPRRRSAKAIHANDIAPVTNIAMPPLGYPRLHRKTRVSRWRQHRVAILLRLGLKQFPARHRNQAHRNVLFLQLLSRQPRSSRLPIRSRSGSSAVCHRGVSARMYAPRRRPSAAANCFRSSVGTFCRVRTRATGRSRVSIATRQATAVSLASAGRMTMSCGIARKLATCSTD